MTSDTPDPTPTTSAERPMTRSSGASPNIEHELMACEHALHEALGEVDVLRAAQQASAERVAALEAEIRLLREMVALLTEAESASLGYLHAHGWHTDPALVERGKQIREQLATLDEHA